MQILKPFRFSYISAKSRAIKSELLSTYFFEELIRSKSTSDIVNHLKITDYRGYIEEDFTNGLSRYFESLFDRLIKPLNRYEREVFYLFFFERKKILDKKLDIYSLKEGEQKIRDLERLFLKRLSNSIKRLSHYERQDLKLILGSYFDVQNIITAVKFRIIFNLKPEQVFPYLIPFYYRVDREKLLKVLSAKTLTDVSDTLLSVVNQSFKDYTQLRKVMYTYHIEQIKKVWYGFPFKLSIPFAVLRLKEIEILNINTIYEGIKFNIGQEEIKRMLIGL